MDIKIRRAIIFVVVMAFMIPLFTPKVFADSTVSIKGGDRVRGGEKFTVTVTFSGDSVGRVDGQMLFDTNKLTYISGGSSRGNTGYIQLKKAGTGEDISFNIKFQAVSSGTTNLEVTVNEMYNLDESYMDPVSADKTVSITGDAQKNQLITEEADADEPQTGTTLKGTDEKPDEGISPMIVLIIIASVLVAAIGIIIAVLIKKRKK